MAVKVVIQFKLEDVFVCIQYWMGCVFYNYYSSIDVVFPEETIDEICGLSASSPTESKTDDKDTSLEELNSSIIKFCLTEATPYRKR